MIRKKGTKYALYTADGSRILGMHASRAEAEKQERAINISKAREAGRRIPKKRA